MPASALNFILDNWLLILAALVSGGLLAWPMVSRRAAAGARNVPLGQLEGGSRLLPTNKALPLVVLCPTGARAGRAVGILKKLGFDNARPVAGGLAAWREANLPVEKSA